MRDKTHIEHIEKWAAFVRDNPRDKWKGEHTMFIDSQIDMANRFYSKLEKTPGGKEKIKRLRNPEWVKEISDKVDSSVARKLGLRTKR